MSHHKFSNLIQLNAESVGFKSLDNEIVDFLNLEIEEKLKTILTQSKKFMRISKRKTMKVDDLNHALTFFNFKKQYGYDSYASAEYERIESINGLWRPKQNIVDLEDFLSKPISSCPMQPFPHFHWFAIDGKRPNIPENFIREEHKPVEGVTANRKESVNYEQNQQGVEKQTNQGAVKASGVNKIVPPVIHNISKELQIFLENFEQRFRKEVKIAKLNPEPYFAISNELQISLNVVETEPGVVELLPYIIQFLMTNLAGKQQSKEPKVDMIILHYVEVILKNPFFYLEPYIHQMVTLVLSMIFMDVTTESIDLTVQVKNFAVDIIGCILKKYETKYPNFTQQLIRICKDNIIPTLRQPCLMTTYGAIKCVNKLGPMSIIELIIPRLDKIIEAFYLIQMQMNKMDVDQPENVNYVASQSQQGSFQKISFSMPINSTIVPPINSSLLYDVPQNGNLNLDPRQEDHPIKVNLSDFKNMADSMDIRAQYVYGALKESAQIVQFYMANLEVKNSSLIQKKLNDVFGEDLPNINTLTQAGLFSS